MNFFGKILRAAVVTTALAALCVVGANAANIGVATVEADGGLRLRAEANTDSSILTTAANGSTVVVVAEADNGWYKVDYNSYEGYMAGEYLSDPVQTADVKLGYGLVNTTGACLNVRNGAGTNFDKVGSLQYGEVVTITGVDSGWFKISYGEGKEGYVSSDYMVTCRDSAGSRGDVQAPAAKAESKSTSLGQQVVAYAKKFLGTRYVYGANGPKSFDCSGFTKYVYKHFGYTLNRSAVGQLSNGTKVSKGDLQPGDLVFFKYKTSKAASHVGMYIGGGQFIHASTTGYQVRIDTLTSGHYSRVFVGGRRIF